MIVFLIVDICAMSDGQLLATDAADSKNTARIIM